MKPNKISLFFIILFLSVYALLAILSSPVAGMGPSATLTSIVLSGGNLNPPGYQAYGFLADGWLQIFPGDSGVGALNHLAALLGAVILTLFGSLFFLWSRHRNWSLRQRLQITVMASLVPLFSSSLPRHAFYAERYSLGVVSALLSFLFLFARPSLLKIFLWLALLTVTYFVHFFCFLFVGGIFVYDLWQMRKHLQWKYGLSAIFGFAVGLIPLFWSYQRALQKPYFNWGDPSNWGNVLRVLSRSERNGINIVRPPGLWGSHFEISLATLWEQSHLFLLLLPIALIFLIWRGQFRIFSLSLFAILVFLAFPFLTLNFMTGAPGSLAWNELIWQFHNYYLYFGIYLGGLALFAVLVLVDGSAKKNGAFSRNFALNILMALSIAGAAISLNANSARKDIYSEVLSQAFLSSYPEDSLLLTNVDSLYFHLMRHRDVLKLKKMKTIHTSLMYRSWYMESLRLYDDYSPAIQKTLQECQTKAEIFEKDRQNSDPLLNCLEFLFVQMGKDYENRGGIFLYEIFDLEPLPAFFMHRFSRESWGLGKRLFTQAQEVKSHDWTSLKPLLSPSCSPAIANWCDSFKVGTRSNLQERLQWIRPVFPEEAAQIETLLEAL